MEPDYNSYYENMIYMMTSWYGYAFCIIEPLRDIQR